MANRDSDRCPKRAPDPNSSEASPALWNIEQTTDPRIGFAGTARLFTHKIVESTSRVGVDDDEWRILLLEACKNGDKRQMLDHIGEIARMKGVAVIHSAMMNKSRNRAILNSLMGPTE